VIGRLLAIAWKELLQLRRDRLTLGMMVMLPVLQLTLFGYAINMDVRNIRTVVFDQDRTAESRDFARGLEVTGAFVLVAEVSSYDDIGRAFRADAARVALVVPAGYSAALVAGRPAEVQLVVDGSDPQTVSGATQTAGALAAARSTELLVTRVARSGAALVPSAVNVVSTTWYNPELETSTFIVPGLTGVILTMTMVMLTAMAIARERERGTLEQLIVAPVGRLEIIGGKILPYIVMGYVQISLVLLVGYLVFDVPIVGSLGLLYALAFAFIASNLALGLFFSTLVKTQQQAMQLSFFFLLPNILLSGFAFPWEGMPKPAQWLSQALPLTHFLRIVRGIILKGATLGDVVGELAWLGGILFVLVALAALRFQKKLV
jgi:ABC-2 type transport system permease protein